MRFEWRQPAGYLLLFGPGIASYGRRVAWELDQVDLSMAAIVVALPAVLPLDHFMMKRLSK